MDLIEPDKKFQNNFLQHAFLPIVIIALISFIEARAAFVFGSRSAGFATIGFSAGITLAVLLLNKPRNWPVTLLFVFIAVSVTNILGGIPLPVSLILAFVNCAEAVLAGSFLRRTNYLTLYQRIRSAAVFFAFVFVSVLISSFAGAIAATLVSGVEFWRLWLNWLAADSLGMGLVTPLILAWFSTYKSVREKVNLSKAKILEGIGIFICLLITLWFLFLFNNPALDIPVLRTYLLFPLLIWCGLRFGQRFVTFLLGLTCIVGFYGTLNGLGQFYGPGQSLVFRILGLQIYLGVLILATLLFRAMFVELKQTGELLAKSESEYHDLFQNAPIGIFHSLPGAGFLMVNPTLAAMLGYETPEEMVSAITSIPNQLYVDSVNYQGVLNNTLNQKEWVYSVNHYRRKDGSLMVGRLSVRKVIDSEGSLAYLEGFVEDITDRKQAEDALKRSETLLNESQAIAKVGGWEYDCATMTVTWTRECYFIYGVSTDFNPDNIQNVLSFYAPGDRELVEKSFNQAVNDGKSFDLELNFLNAQGVKMWVRTRANPVMESGRVVKVTGTIMDISERKLAESSLTRSEEQLRLAMDASNDGLWDQHFLENFTYFSPGYCRMLGYDQDEIPNTIDGWLGLVHPDDLERVRSINQNCRENRIPAFEIEMRMRARDGGWKWILSRGRPVYWDGDGKPLRIIGTHVDITERKEVEQALRRANRKLEKQAVANDAMQALLIELATHDSLTGLYNRRFMNDALQREISRANREEISVSVLMLDIDHFKFFNDTYGHEAGDQMLVALSSLLRQKIRESDIACRYGGEEFIIILPGAGVLDAKNRANILCQSFSEVRIGPAGLSSTISIGLSVYPQHGSNVDELLHAADMALYTAKAAGRNCVRVRVT